MSRKSNLKSVLDPNDQFMIQGHQVVWARSYDRPIPQWSKSDEKIKKLLLQVFPKLATDENQRKSAARWASVIHLYFRMGYTRSQIAEEIGSTVDKVSGVIRSICRASNGQRANDAGRRGCRRRGRPAKRLVSCQK